MTTLIKTAIATLALAAATAASAQATAPASPPAADTRQSQPSTGRTRAEVIAEVIEARKNGTLIETEADMDVAQTRKHIAK
ncbi:hypothetical protein ASD15_22265 [Massilia sp. Root351]|jgi:DNA-binding IclR family transcriptional regulator|uniref:DUF4148 domain-containing protein n=1 Tax=Massilia sp. Root351 TaxID=1736522 RepID=UPI00070F80A1|nr:DUF4148 domain-containing protein [Massilia sp. Root351]KQV78532.1 hypothetical protein ASD15_22265 [Massilia sp. Root351]